MLLGLALLAVSCAAGAAERIVAVGDIHGAYRELLAVLNAAGLADAEGHWAGGDATLVQVGDVLDRGPDERRVLDLLMSLEGEAKAAGGRVVVLLGNHEIMSMLGDWRYVSPAALADFGGADARRAALAPDGKYGRWLRARPAIVAIDGTVFVHGGVSADLSQLGARGMRQRVREELARMDAARTRAIKTRVLQQDGDLDALLELKLPQLAHYPGWLISHQDGPFWFRGFAELSDEKLEALLSELLPAFRAKRFVSGHSVQLPGAIRVRAGGRVLLIDTGMLGPPTYPGGQPVALELRGARLGTIAVDGTRTPLDVETRASARADDRPPAPEPGITPISGDIPR